MLTNRAKYAIKALLHLARQAGKGPVQAAVIAEAEGIPHKFLEAILIQLRHKGIIRSKVGKGGGHEIAQKPGDIDLLTIVRAIDGPVAPLPCLSHTAYVRCDDCVDEATCAIRKVLLAARDATAQVLESRTIAQAAVAARKAGWA